MKMEAFGMTTFRLPNFIICGAQKSGTTSLFHYLSKHPKVFLPQIKELKYFSDFYDKGTPWYAEFFAGAQADQLIGEVSPQYMLHADVVAKRMYELIPAAKLVFVLRNPVERAYSMYNFDIQRGKYNDIWNKSFEQILAETRGHEYLKNGEYSRQIAHFLQYYSKESIQLLIFEDLIEDPARELQKLYRFLQVPSNVADLPVENKTRVLRVRAISPVLRYLHNYRLLNQVPRPIKQFLGPIIYSKQSYTPMKQQTREQLLAHYAAPNQALSQQFQLDLHKWHM